MYQRTGAAALKLDLSNIKALCQKLGNPQAKFQSLHIAGTNGKGSCSHMLGAILQSAGYKTGLYTSPHLKDFRERIRIDGEPIHKSQVVAFVAECRPWLDEIKPSFFELTVALAFKHFANSQVDMAVIEVGLGGRLDSTNVIQPLVSTITNIGMDHRELLGDTLELIAGEKAGIIKAGVPVVVGERQRETDHVFMAQAEKLGSAIFFAQDDYQVSVGSSIPMVVDVQRNGLMVWQSLKVQLQGPYQHKNLATVLKTLDVLKATGFSLELEAIPEGLSKVIDLTGIKGRWQVLGENPTIICDTGHNRSAMEYLILELQRINRNRLHMVIGFVNDKDIRSMLSILPKDASYYFCRASVPRSMPAESLLQLASEYQLSGTAISDPNKALTAAKTAASTEDIIFVGGSTFVVAELKELNE